MALNGETNSDTSKNGRKRCLNEESTETEEVLEKKKARLSDSCTTTKLVVGADNERSKRERKKKKKKKKEKSKRKKKKRKEKREDLASDEETERQQRRGRGNPDKMFEGETKAQNDDKIVQNSALDFVGANDSLENGISLLLFYQYVEPVWDHDFYRKTVLLHMEKLGTDLQLTGRMRVAKEGLNCTLTGSHDSILSYCSQLRNFHNGEFSDTEFKITKDLPTAQKFPNLKVIPVSELVHYGLDADKTPSITYAGNHLEPAEYHQKLAEEGTVVIDVRNHYEAAIGHFDPPVKGAQWLDPEMRKSTEFPVWLNKPETKEKLRGKQVLMYCTGGVRCERASALLNYKIETEADVKDLGIKGVYQLQGGIDKYFKEIPDGGFWKGKNYVFDKRFAHAPPRIEAAERVKNAKDAHRMGNCEACGKPWDMYRGKRRCPTCGVPSLICRDCFQAHSEGTKIIGRNVKCDLCVQQNITSKSQIREREEQELREYERAQMKVNPGVDGAKKMHSSAPNPDGVTRLLVKNMCKRKMNEATLLQTLPGITHIVWRTDRQTGQFYGSGWVEMASAEQAAQAVGMNGTPVLGRPLYINFDPPDAKDSWPPPNSAVAW